MASSLDNIDPELGGLLLLDDETTKEQLSLSWETSALQRLNPHLFTQENVDKAKDNAWEAAKESRVRKMRQMQRNILSGGVGSSGNFGGCTRGVVERRQKVAKWLASILVAGYVALMLALMLIAMSSGDVPMLVGILVPFLVLALLPSVIHWSEKTDRQKPAAPLMTISKVVELSHQKEDSTRVMGIDPSGDVIFPTNYQDDADKLF